jgi:branched-chain amino acid transport system permease protein
MGQIIINIVSTSAIFLLIAVSFSLIYYPTRIFHLAHGVIITLGAYFVFLFAVELSIPFVASILLSLIASTIIGVFCDLLVYRPMRKRTSALISFLIVSIGLYEIFQNCISLLFGDDVKIIRSGNIDTGYRIFGGYITGIQIFTISVSIFLFVFILIFLRKHKTGRNIRAVAANAELAKIQGIDSNHIITWSFFLGSAIAAITGVLIAYDTGLKPTMGFSLLLYGIVVMIIGGIGSSWGLIWGSFLLAIAQNLTSYFLDNNWMDAISFLILISFLAWKPLGFKGTPLKKIEI